MMGMQGSGKGTHGKILAQHLGLPLLVTGDLFRDEIRGETEIGKELADYVKRGDLAPDSYSKMLVERELKKPEFDKGAVIDGYPRTMQMAKDMETMIEPDWIVYLKTTDEETIKRITNRRQCENGHVYNLLTMKPKQEGVCDIDNLPLSQREDDREEIIRNRLKIFHEKTEPVIEYFRKQGKVVDIEACCSLEEISERIRDVIDAKIRAR